MALRYAVATGNWSNTATWDGGTLPAPGDVVRANTFTVTVDQDVTGIEFRTDASTPAAAGGLFLIAGTRVVGANVFAGTTVCVSIGSNANVAFAGNVIAGSSTNAYGISMGNSAGTLVLTGNIVGGTAPNCIGLAVFNAVHTVTINGNILGGSNSSAYGVQVINNNPTVNITGNSTSMTAIGLLVSSGTVIMTGEHRGVTTTVGTLVQNGTLNCLSGSSAVGGQTSGIWGIQIAGGTLNFTGSLTSGTVNGTTNAAINVAGGVATINVESYTQTAFGNCFRITAGSTTVNYAGGTFTTGFSQAVFNIQAGSTQINCATIQGGAGTVVSVTSTSIVELNAEVVQGSGTASAVTNSMAMQINGNITGGSTAITAVVNTGNLFVIGNVTGGSVADAHGVRTFSGGNKARNVVIYGTVTGGSHVNAQGMSNQGPEGVYIFGTTVNATGNATSNTGSGSITVVPTGGGGVSSFPFAYAG